MEVNKFDLSRVIPAEIKREIRQQCGFGCVICGLGIIQYEHVDPEFKDAKKHDPANMTLLCPQCHSKVTTKMWSTSRVKLAMRMPKCLQQGYSNEFFDFPERNPSLIFGGVKLSNCKIPIQVANYPLFQLKKPEYLGQPFLLSGLFTDSNGEVSLEIKDNEWKANSSLWDVEVKGPCITIRERHRKIHLVLTITEQCDILVSRLDMVFAGFYFEANGDYLKVTFPDGGSSELSGCVADNCNVGISF